MVDPLQYAGVGIAKITMVEESDVLYVDVLRVDVLCVIIDVFGSPRGDVTFNLLT